jgi:hypothetical protein
VVALSQAFRSHPGRHGNPDSRAQHDEALSNLANFAEEMLSDDGMKAWQEVQERGYEGCVAKDEASPYSGGRTLSWLKVKQKEYRVEERGWSPSAR